jgi:predicted RNase H-like nuclease (RuvC/YqgF family)
VCVCVSALSREKPREAPCIFFCFCIEKEDQNSDLGQLLTESNDKNVLLNTKNLSLEAENNRLKTIAEENGNKGDNGSEEIRALHRKIELMKDQIKDMHDNKMALENENACVQEVVCTLGNKIDELEDTIEQLQKDDEQLQNDDDNDSGSDEQQSGKSNIYFSYTVFTL